MGELGSYIMGFEDESRPKETMSANAPEPPPLPVEGPAVWDLVQEDMRERDKLGEAKYGVRLTANDGRCSMVDAYQEQLDLVVYMRKHLEENAQLRARLAEVEAERDRYHSALDSINDIRNSIVGCQGFNFSEHAYPLVEALNGAGIVGEGYPVSRKNVGTMLERVKAAEADRDQANRRAAGWEAAFDRDQGQGNVSGAKALTLEKAMQRELDRMEHRNGRK